MTKTLLNDAVDILARVDKQNREMQNEQQEQAKKNWQLYVSILRRSKSPLPGDDRELILMMDGMNISGEQVLLDRALVLKAVEMEGLFEYRDNAAKKVDEARLNWNEWERARLADQAAQNALARCTHEAPGELHRLAHRRPELFDNQDPPRLLGYSG